MEEVLILKQEEFEILAVAIGFTRVYGIKSAQSLDEKLFMYGIHEMTEKGMLCVEGADFVVQEPYKTALLTMKAADKIMAIQGFEKDLENGCFYLGEKIVLLTESVQDKKAFRLTIYEKESFYQVLEEKRYLPETCVDLDIIALQSENEIREKLEGVILSADETYKENLVYETFSIMSKESVTSKERKIYVINDPYNYWIAEELEEELILEHYDKETLFHKLKQIIDSE